MNTLLAVDACVNHGGNFEALLDLLKIIHNAQIVTGSRILFKMQKRDPEVYSSEPYNSWALNRVVPYREHKRFLEFGLEEFKVVNEIASECDIEWYCSAFDFKSLDFLVKQFPKLRYWKIASPVTADQPALARAISEQNGLKFLSTGMCSVEELDRTVNEVAKVTNYDDLILLHCISMYPTPIDQVNLATMRFLNYRYGYSTGYSSHDIGVDISVAAVAMGAHAIEKHITSNKSSPGPDHALSVDENELIDLVKRIQIVERSIGIYDKPFYENEKIIRDKVRIAA